jgi:hypothetical protein
MQQAFPARLWLRIVPGSKAMTSCPQPKAVDGVELEVLEQQPARPTSWKAKSLAYRRRGTA